MWPKFGQKPRKNDGYNHQQSCGPGRPKNLATTAEGPQKECGSPSTYARERLPKDFAKHQPKHYFDLQLMPDFFKKHMVEPTNKRAASEGAGTRTYKDWAPFDVSEIYKICGMLCLSAMSPKPQFKYWFFTSGESKLWQQLLCKSPQKEVDGRKDCQCQTAMEALLPIHVYV